MLNAKRFGVCGLIAGLYSFCLSTVSSLPQSADSAPARRPIGDESPPEDLPRLALQQLQDQNVAMLKALDQLRNQREAALTRYTEAISSQLAALSQAVTIQGEKQLQAAQKSNRLVLTVGASIAALAAFMMLTSALLPIWALKHFGRGGPNLRVGVLVGHPALAGDAPVLAKAESPALAPALGSAVESLEKRLLALEKRAGEVQLAPQKALPAHPPNRPEVAARASKFARVAITVGEGAAIGFLPREVALPPFHSLRIWLDKLKRLGRQTRAAKP